MSYEPPQPRSDTMDIVMAVVATLNDVIEALRSEIAALAESEKRRSKRLTVYLVGLAVIAAATVVGIGLNYRQGQNVKTIVHYIQDCQKPDSDCKRRNDAVIADAVIGISGAVFDATSCVQSVPLPERTDTKVKECRDRYIGKPK